jgi:enterochelin esterase-like enzyme
MLGMLAGAAGLTAAGLVVASPAASAGNGHHVVFSPQVIHTGTAPTGYQVTFRYYDPAATTVQVRGEWFFSSPAGTTTTSSQGLLPAQWQPGDFPIAYPNQGPAPNWPVAQMALNKATGVWSYTTPLPSGTFTYGFYVNCTSPPPGLAGCTELSDPSNPPWNKTGSMEPDSQVYVPSDPRFGTLNLSWQAPGQHARGRLLDVSYPDPQSTSPVGSHPLAVYLPPGYNPRRRVPYPTLYLSHGADGNEVDWTTQGAATSILDNLIAARKIQPMVVVMTNFNNLGTCTLLDGSCYAQDVKDYVIPFVNKHFNVSAIPDQRAFAGLSAGGARANYLLFNDTTLFGYYGSWSIGSLDAPAATSPLWQNPALRTRLGIQLGGGKFDELTVPGIYSYAATFETNGIPVTTELVTGGHEWYTWRQLLYNFLTTVAFKHHGATH